MEQDKELLVQNDLQESNHTQNSEETETQPSMEELLAQEELSLDLPRQGQIRSGVVVGINDDEILVSIGAKSEGIIPGKEISQLDPEERNEIVLGKEITVYVVTPEDTNGNLLLSRSKAIEEEDWSQAEKLVASSEIHEGSIAGYNKGGLIVKMGRLRGFVPASQVSPSRRMAYGGNTPDQRWAKMTGQSIIVKTIEVDRERRRLIFSELAALQESREIFKERLLEEIKEGDVLNGRVTSLADFGAFVNINGADGLVHMTEISWEHISHPSQALKVGQEVKVKVINIDEENKRIGLSIRQLQSDPWPDKVSTFREGQLVQAKIVRLAKFGAFARLENTDLEGLIHISELSDQRVEHPKEVLKDGDVMTLRVIKIDPSNHRIGLSLRKVHSLAYADLDLKMALAEGGESEEDEPEAAETDQTEE
jgi:small subunit ribosomal protein S1